MEGPLKSQQLPQAAWLCWGFVESCREALGGWLGHSCRVTKQPLCLAGELKRNPLSPPAPQLLWVFKSLVLCVQSFQPHHLLHLLSCICFFLNYKPQLTTGPLCLP